MSRMRIAISGIGLVATVPVAIMSLREFVETLLYPAGSHPGFELGSVGCACAATLALNAALLTSPRRAGVGRLVIAHVMLAPFAAWCCLLATVDPVALVVALPMVAAVAVTLGTPSWRLRRFVASQ